MKKFVFNLQSVLDYRNYEVLKQEGEVSKALGEELKIQNKIKDLEHRYEENSNLMIGSHEFYLISRQLEFNNFVHNETERYLCLLEEARKVTQKQREILRGLIQKRDSLSKLKDRLYEEYLKEEEREEEQALDDIVTAKYSKRLAHG